MDRQKKVKINQTINRKYTRQRRVNTKIYEYKATYRLK